MTPYGWACATPAGVSPECSWPRPRTSAGAGFSWCPRSPRAGASTGVTATRWCGPSCRSRASPAWPGPADRAPLHEAAHEGEGGVGHFAPTAVDRERVPPVGHLGDLGEALVALLLLVGRVGQGPRHGVVLLAGDDEQRPALRILRVHLRLRPRIEVGAGRLEQR